MAISSPNPKLDTLIADLLAGGYMVSAIRRAPGSFERVADVHLNNGVIVNWDDHSRILVTRGLQAHCENLDGYFRNLYGRSWMPRWLAVVLCRWVVACQACGRMIALWLLRSDSFGARMIRRRIELNPGQLVSSQRKRL